MKKNSAGGAMRNKVFYLQQAKLKPIYQALKDLQGFLVKEVTYEENLCKLFMLIEINILGITVDWSAERRLWRE